MNDRGLGLSDFARLEEKLTKLRQRERAPGEGRKLKGDTADALIAALVAEIDETILPRRLTLSGGDMAIHLAVANRRLQAMLDPAASIEGAAELAGAALPDAEDPSVPALRAILETAFSKETNFSISARRLDVSYGSDIGVPANLLARAWGVSDAGPAKALAPNDVLSTFLTGLGDDVTAWLRIEGEEVSDQTGSADRLASLGEQAAIFLDGYFGKFEALFPADAKACGTVIAPKSGSGDAMMFVEIGEVSAFVAAAPDKILPIAMRWQALVAE